MTDPEVAPAIRLDQLARIIRSKNAGPLMLTLDLIFDTEPAFARVVGRLDFVHREVARRYGRQLEDVTVISYPPARAIKIVMARRHVAGTTGDTDVYGAQQHAPLLDIAI